MTVTALTLLFVKSSANALPGPRHRQGVELSIGDSLTRRKPVRGAGKQSSQALMMPLNEGFVSMALHFPSTWPPESETVILEYPHDHGRLQLTALQERRLRFQLF